MLVSNSTIQLNSNTHSHLQGRIGVTGNHTKWPLCNQLAVVRAVLWWCWHVQLYRRLCQLCCCLATCSSSRRRTRTKQSCLTTQVHIASPLT